MATNELPTHNDDERDSHPVYQRELLKALIEVMHKQNAILANLTETMRDLRDELEHARTERKAART